MERNLFERGAVVTCQAALLMATILSGAGANLRDQPAPKSRPAVRTALGTVPAQAAPEGTRPSATSTDEPKTSVKAARTPDEPETAPTPVPRVNAIESDSASSDSSDQPSMATLKARAASDESVNDSAAMTTAKLDLDFSVSPGQMLQPIDLGNTLRMAGARNLDIAIARERINQSMADLSKARALWLPSLFIGPTWYRADGKVQTVNGQVQTIDRNSLFLGGLAATNNGFPAPSPGTGYPPLNGYSSVLRISDAIFEPMAARRVVQATRAKLQAVNNDALLASTEAYFDLQQASGRLAIAREAAGNAAQLTKITKSYSDTGEGLEADHRRALAELNRQRTNFQALTGQFQVASANLVRQLVLNPSFVLGPVEPAEAVICLIPDQTPLEDLLVLGLRNRPELAEAQETVQATLIRWKQARLRPFIPSVGLSYAGGGFGGGQNGFFGNFGSRGDVAATLFWELQNLGFTDRAIARRSAADHRIADLDLIKTQTTVAADVVSAYQTRVAATKQMTQAAQTVHEALESLRLNFVNIRLGSGLKSSTRPIEVLQPIQALAQARTDYLDAVLTYNRSQFRLKRAIGQQP